MADKKLKFLSVISINESSFKAHATKYLKDFPDADEGEILNDMIEGLPQIDEAKQLSDEDIKQAFWIASD